MGCPARPRLVHELDRPPRQKILDRIRLGSDDHEDALHPQAETELYRVRDHGPAEPRGRSLGDPGPHPGPFPGSQNDGAHLVHVLLASHVEPRSECRPRWDEPIYPITAPERAQGKAGPERPPYADPGR